MWVRFVGKTGRGTLFNFGNPTSQDSPYGFRLETFTREDLGVYRRMVRLVVRDDRNEVKTTDLPNGIVYDSHFGTVDVARWQTHITGRKPLYDTYTNLERFQMHTQIPTGDLNEWFFICATYNPLVDEENSFLDAFNIYFNDTQFWLNHRNSDGTLAAQGKRANGDLLGAKCKVEVISRSDLLRARGYKIDSLEVDVTEPEQEQQLSGN